MAMFGVLAVANAAQNGSLEIAGAVFASSGSPIAGARAELFALQPGQAPTSKALASATADQHGRFLLEAPAPGLYAVEVTMPGFVPMQYRPLAVVEARRLVPVVLQLASDAEFQVRNSDGTPRSDVHIEAQSSLLTPALEFGLWRPAPRSAATNAVGRAVLPRLRGERIDVRLRVPGLAYSALRQGVTQATFVLPAVGPRAGLPDPNSDSEAPLPLVHLSGRVLDHAGSPFGGALVWSAADPGRFTSSDKNGVFELRALAGQKLKALAAGYLEGESEPQQGRASLRLQKALAGFGRVVDLEERPLADVEISLRAAGDLRGARSPFLHTRSDAEGRFEIAGLPSPAFDLRARLRGYVTTTVLGIEAGGAAGGDLGTILLPRGVSVTGKVMDEAGLPIPEVRIFTFEDVLSPVDRLLAAAPSEPPAATSDASGLFAIEGLLPGRRQHLLLRAEGFLPLGVSAVEAPAEEAKPLELVLRRAASLRGRVLDEDGQAVAGATVEARPVFALAEMALPGKERYANIRSDETGAFSFPELFPGSYTITAKAPDYLPSGPRELRLPAGSEAPELVLELARGAVLSGRVQNARGEAVADARIFVADGGGRTDAEGAFRFGGLAPGLWEARVVHPAYRTLVRQVRIEERGESVFDVELPNGHPVHGRVVDDAGMPVFGAQLLFEIEDSEDSYRQRAMSDENGFFELAEVPDGNYRVFGERQGFARLEQASALRVEGRDVRDLELVLERGAVVEGEIHGLDFDALSTLRLWAEPAKGRRLAGQVSYDGHFHIDDLGSGPLLLVAELPGEARQARARLLLLPGEKKARRDLFFGGSELEGEVLLDGEALAGAQIELESRDAALRRQTISDHRGQFRLADLPAGRYRLHVSEARHLVSKSQELLLGEGAETLRIEIVSASLRGTIRSAAGDELKPGARISLFLLAPEAGALTGNDPMSLFAVTSEKGGSYHVPRLSAGRYRFTVESDGFAFHEEEIVLPAGETEHSVTLEKTLGLDLHIQRQDGPLPKWVSAEFLAADGTWLRESRVLDTAGVAHFASLPKGRYRLRLEAPGCAVIEREIEAPGITDVVLSAAGSVEVWAPGLAESDAFASLTLRGPGGNPQLVTSSARGTATEHLLVAGAVRLENVPPGTFTLEIRAEGGRTFSREFRQIGSAETRLVLD